MAKRLIVNADDYGITEGVTRAILNCHEVGALHSTTLMVGMEASGFAAAEAKNHPELGIGLHFTLTLGKPVAPTAEVVSLLDATGEFRSRRQQERALLLGKVDPDHIRRELRAQMDRLLEFGVTPTHIDSHQHIHMMPPVFDAVLEMADEMGIRLRMPWQWKGLRKGLKNAVKSSALKFLLWRNQKQISDRVLTNRYFCSLFDLTHDPGAVNVGMYGELLNEVDDVTELMVHPAIADDGLRKLIRISDMGEKEHALLCSPEFSEIVKERGFEQSTFADIAV